MKLILASASLGRKKLLTSLKIPFEVITTDTDEDNILAKTPVETVMLRAKHKGEKAIKKISNSQSYPLVPSAYLILAADTEAVLDGQVIGKPKDYSDAVRILKTLSGKTHEVITAVYLFKLPKLPRSLKKLIYSGYDRSLVTFRKLTENDIKRYLSITEYKRYTGSYAVFDSPQDFITKVEGSLSNVIGLPLEKVIPFILPQHKSQR